MNEWSSWLYEIPLKFIELNYQLKYVKKGMIQISIDKGPEVTMLKARCIVFCAGGASIISYILKQ